jgi:CBS domain-containing protein
MTMSALRTILDDKAKAVQYVGPEATAHDAVTKMCAHHIGSLLVEENGEPIGIISERDIMTRLVLEQRDAKTTSVRDIMTTDVVCIDPDREPEQIMALMTEKRVRHVPVVENRKVVGLVSIGDLVRWVTRSQDFEIRVMRDYVLGVYPG